MNELRMASGLLVCIGMLASATSLHAQAPVERTEYRILATNKTSTMQKEMQEAAAAGFRYGGLMGGDTAFGS
jgi:hypothetical protein